MEAQRNILHFYVYLLLSARNASNATQFFANVDLMEIEMLIFIFIGTQSTLETAEFRYLP